MANLGPILAGLLVAQMALSGAAWSSPVPVSMLRNRDFHVPAALRPRVNFWKDIFTRYGQYEVVIHHKDYPHIIFMVLDLRSRAAELNVAAFDSFKRREVEKRIAEVKAAFHRLAGGAGPITSLEERIENVMRAVPESYGKYKRVLDEDLVRSQTGIRDKFMAAIRRSGRYLPAIERIFVREFGIPLEITRLPFVESSFDYQAYSSAGAAGIWQLMPGTARIYMTVNQVIDERLDPIEATQAAARYLSSAYRTLGTWPLAIISYNHGVAGVAKKVRKMGTTDIVTLIENRAEHAFGFASANFYPSFLAAVEAYEERKIHFPGVEPEPPMDVTRYRVPAPVSALYLSRQLGLELSELRRCNYALLEPIWSGRANIPAGYMLQVPSSYEGRLASLHIPEAQPQVIAPASSAVYGGVFYRVKKGDTLGQIARKYGTSVANLKQLNKLSNRPLRAGELLMIKEREAAHKKVSSPVNMRKEEKKVALDGTAVGVMYKVRPGDTIHSLARKFGVSVENLVQANNIKSGMIRVGQSLIIPPKTSAQSVREGEKQSSSPSDQASAAGRTHVVKQGESIWIIARRYNVKVASIKEINQLTSDKLKIGQVLKIP